eukprot:TRINITY_DN3565_c0_g1_i1.p2 TRINITY_DN3565_c0_g1~~TRINITY_DN3565_c0_g1_i1.p2  ORF type:complete len:362 (+),score=45.04 TRINITY_DN3565_c0_g1_i1:1292-2377(+)
MHYQAQQSLTKISRSVFPDHSICISGRDYPVHKSWILNRCPALLNASLSNAVIDDGIVQEFFDFVYSSMPLKVSKDPSIMLSQAYLCSVAGFEDESLMCLKYLYRRARKLKYDAETLLEQGSAACPGFHKGEEVCKALIHKKKIPSPDMEPADSSLIPSSFSFVDSLEKQWLSREETGDFVISLGNSANAHLIRCHSFILHSRWSYFAMVIDSRMAEAQKRVLTLPEPGDPDSLPADVLLVILSICYTGTPDPSSMVKLDNNSLWSLLECHELYLSPVGPGSLFSPLVSYASALLHRSVTVDNCVEIFQHATKHSLGDLAEHAASLIVVSLPTLKKDPQFRARFDSLPSDLQIQLLWAFVR